MRFSVLLVPVLLLIIPSMFENKHKEEVERDWEKVSVSKVLEALGEEPCWELDSSIPGVSAQKGYDLFHTGFITSDKGNTRRKQSKHFVCTSCHNIEKEDPDLSVSDPEARLSYTSSKGLPFLQGTTMYGAVSRRTFYNDDYEKKYGDLVFEARENIRNAIQLCAVECAQGRELEDWEIESLLAYLWTIDLKIADLNLNASELGSLNTALDNEEQSAEIATLIKSKYMAGSPAHFSDPNIDREMYGKSADMDNGELVYKQSCLHCHENGRYSYFHLDTTAMSMKYLTRKVEKYNDLSIYQVVRYGVHSVSGRKSYMPHYPLEKMSHQQLLDLRAYIENKG